MCLELRLFKIRIKIAPPHIAGECHLVLLSLSPTRGWRVVWRKDDEEGIREIKYLYSVQLILLGVLSAARLRVTSWGEGAEEDDETGQ